MRAGQAVLALGVHRLAQSHQREAERPVVRTVSSAEIAVVQFDLDQPPDEQLGRWKGPRAQDADRERPGLLGELPGNRPEGHRGVGQAGYEILGRGPRALLDIGLPGLRAGISRPVLARTRPDQQVAHGVGVAGHVSQDVPPGPARQQRRLAQVRVRDQPGRAQQALGRVVDLVVQAALRVVHPPTVRPAMSAARRRPEA